LAQQIGLSDEVFEIALPIYEHNIQQQMEGNDMNINTSLLSLAAIRETVDAHTTQKRQNSTNDDDDSKVEFEITREVYEEIQKRVNFIDIYDLEQDLKDKVLRSTLKAIIGHSPQVHWWRVIKFAVRYFDDGWRLSDDLLRNHQAMYAEWIGNDEFLKVAKNREYILTWVFEYICDRICAKTVTTYEHLLSVFERTEFDVQLKRALKGKEFREEWVAAMQRDMDSEIIALFAKKQYPVPVQNP